MEIRCPPRRLPPSSVSFLLFRARLRVCADCVESALFSRPSLRCALVLSALPHSPRGLHRPGANGIGALTRCAQADRWESLHTPLSRSGNTRPRSNDERRAESLCWPLTHRWGSRVQILQSRTAAQVKSTRLAGSLHPSLESGTLIGNPTTQCHSIWIWSTQQTVIDGVSCCDTKQKSSDNPWEHSREPMEPCLPPCYHPSSPTATPTDPF